MWRGHILTLIKSYLGAVHSAKVDFFFTLLLYTYTLTRDDLCIDFPNMIFCFYGPRRSWKFGEDKVLDLMFYVLCALTCMASTPL